MAGIIPFEPGIPEQRLEIALNDVPYALRVRWNTRDAAWYLDVYEQDGKQPIAHSVKLVLGTLFGRSSMHPLFQGGLFMVDSSSTGVEAGLNDLGGRVRLWYLTPLDLDLARAPALGTDLVVQP